MRIVNKPIVIFRGDDTSAFNLRSIKIILKGDLDLSSAIAKFSLLDYRKEWTVQEVASGELTMSFTSTDTKAMPLGEQTGTFRLYDMSTGEPRQLTVVNKIPFLVTNRVCELDEESYHADVSVASGEIISIEFNVGVGAVNGKADKVKNAVEGDLAGLDENGNLTDSGIPASDVLRKSQMDTTPTAGSLNPVTSGGIKQAIDDATPSDYEQVKAQVEQNASDIGDIEEKIPSQASAQNQLADKAFVNSSIATNTATFRGTYNLVTDLSLTTSATHEQVAAAIKAKLAALSITPENNDYCFVQVPKSDAEPTVIVRVDRYKCTVEDGVSSWDYEWSLNNSSFTAEQWAAINSGITSALVTKLGALPTAQELAAALLAKYEKPSGGIPKTDLSAGVQASLDKADSALQTAPVTSVNNKTGAVSLTASDVGALPGRVEESGYVYTIDFGGGYKIQFCWEAGGTFIRVFNANGKSTLLFYDGTISKQIGNNFFYAEMQDKDGTIAYLSDIPSVPIKSVKLNGTALTPDANGAVNVIVPTKLNDVCGEVENWLGVPGTTSAGKSIKVLAKTVNGVIEGGMTVTGSSSNNNNTTKYRYGGMTVTRNGVATDYLFDSSQYGVARLIDIAGKLGNSGDQTLSGDLTLDDGGAEKSLWFTSATGRLGLDISGGHDDRDQTLWNWPLSGFTGNKVLALLSDIYAAVQQIAPAFTSKAYVWGELCTYNGMVYRCKLSYTATASSAKPSSDTTHWEAKKVSELFAPLASPAFTGTPTVPDIGENAPDGQIVNKKYVDEHGGQTDIGLSVVNGLINVTFDE